MAAVIGNTARGLLGLQRTLGRRVLVGTCLQNRVSTSAMLGQTSESPSENNKKIYEMRTYYIKPKDFGKGPIVNYVPGGGGGFQKSVVFQNLTPQKTFEVKMIPPSQFLFEKRTPPPTPPRIPKTRVGRKYQVQRHPKRSSTNCRAGSNPT